VLSLDDVTETRDVQVRAQTQDRLAAIGQLAAGIAHDFNNLLAVIVLHAEMGLLQGELSPRLRDYLGTILNQANRAGDLVQQVLDFSRRAVLERRPLRLGPFVAEQARLLARTLPESIAVCFADEEVDYTVSADPTRLQQVIVNLALNARDAMIDGGDLCFALELIDAEGAEGGPLPELREGRWVRLSVRDTGHGIPAQVLPHIFEPFYTTKAPLGTGLGLAQVHGIVKQHEGEIDVVSEAGVGTTFALYLPAIEAAPPEPPPTTEDALPLGHGETVLVVEDDAAVRMALVASLEQLDYQPAEARNGREALGVMARRGEEIALVLSDLIMPEMGGRALQAALREQGFTAPVVFLSGHPMDLEPLPAGAESPAPWLQKPVNLESLARLLARILTVRH
jgi:nitrogen-specific signal transduction histidine kinase/CheY-like chemotaxis protein